MTSKSILLTVTLFASGCGHFRTSDGAKNPQVRKPDWQVDIRNIDGHLQTGDLVTWRLAFLNDERVVAGAIFESTPLLTAFEVRTGRVCARSEPLAPVVESVSFDKMEFAPVSDGLLVLMGYDVTLFDSTLRVLKKRTLTKTGLPSGQDQHWSVTSSPRDAVLLTEYSRSGTVGQHWVDPNTLKDLSSGTGLNYSPPNLAITQNSVIFNDIEHPERNELRVWHKSGQTGPLCPSCFGAIGSVFGTRQLAFLSSRPDASFMIVDPSNGQLVMQGTRESPGEFMRSPSGAREANRVVTYTYVAGRIRVLVADADTRSVVWESEVEQVREVSTNHTTTYGLRLALSANGKKLAILQGTHLSAYSLP
jgi:hypothetical protein